MTESPQEAAAAAEPMREVKYSLLELLAKAENERKQSALAREMVDQGEIREFFKTRKKGSKRRART